MPLWCVIAAIAAVISVMSVATTSQESLAVEQGQARAIAGNMCIVRNGLASYKQDHPGAIGPVALAALTSMPSWFRALDGVETVIDGGGRGMVFYRRAAPATLAQELRTCGATVQGNAPVGVVRDSKLVETSSGAIILDPVTGVPEGAVTIIWR